MIDPVRNFSYILANSAYYTSGIFDYVFESVHSLPVIDSNKRRGILPNQLSVDRKIGIDLGRELASLFPQV